MDYGTTTRDDIATAIVQGTGRDVHDRPVETDGASRVPALLADLLRGKSAAPLVQPLPRRAHPTRRTI